MAKKIAKGRVARYLPLKRRSARKELVTDAISDSNAEEIREIFLSHFENKGHVQACMDELSDKIYQIKNRKRNNGNFLSISEQRKNVKILQKAFNEILSVLGEDSETSKRIYLSVGGDRKSSQESYKRGQKRIRKWRSDFEAALDYAASRLPPSKRGANRDEYLDYYRWLMQEIAAIWHEEAGQRISVAEDSSLGRANSKRVTKGTQIRRLFEIALSEAGAKLSPEQITRYMFECSNSDLI